LSSKPLERNPSSGDDASDHTKLAREEDEHGNYLG
jgi:hypothetical protein